MNSFLTQARKDLASQLFKSKSSDCLPSNSAFSNQGVSTLVSFSSVSYWHHVHHHHSL